MPHSNAAHNTRSSTLLRQSITQHSHNSSVICEIIAPPLVLKRALPPDPPDAGNRVWKTKSTIGKAPRTTSARSNLLSKKLDASKEDIVNEKVLCEVHSFSDSSLDSDVSMEVNTVVDAEDGPYLDPFEEEDPLRSKNPQIASLISPKPIHAQSDRNQRNVTSLMTAIKGLLDSTNDYLQNLETQHLGIGSDFLALLSDGASRAMRGQRVYVLAPDIPRVTPVSTNLTWAKIAALQDPAYVSFKRRNIKSSPPQGQSKEDRRIMIRLVPDHEARKSGTFELRQIFQKLVPDSSLISDV
ncbi:hypothetical protein EV44_g3392 [Erysiphe necator]|uniref:Uncharacterized protein n=1 Tax=Uncinula necator TaxID=52586 RepID=A0A0B1PDC7_UNCNE|nr:hypothetical protein EV44_g3392 [Erysiphe necator]